jgi:hypothetical protein
MRWLLLLLGASGCDAVFGLDEPGLPRCAVGDGFDNARVDDVRTEVDAFTFDKKREHSILSIRGLMVEADGEKGEPQELGLSPSYLMMSVAFEPNGAYVFVTPAVESPVAQTIVKRDGKWQVDPHVPKGVYVGTPTDSMADQPVRAVARLFENVPEYLEYERAPDGSWSPVGAPFTLDATHVANLTPDGLALVYQGIEKDEPGVYVAQRASLDESFREPIRVFAGVHRAPQLFDGCSVLMSIEPDGVMKKLTR